MGSTSLKDPEQEASPRADEIREGVQAHSKRNSSKQSEQAAGAQARAWPKHTVSITLKNLSEDTIEYRYVEDQEPQSGVLRPYQISERSDGFTVNTEYQFELRCHGRETSVRRFFTRDQDWNLAMYFV